MSETQVLIVGGGPVGLSMAALLGRFGIDTTLVERRPGANPHPRARSVNVRTAEIFRQWGLLDELRSVSLPEEWTTQFVYTESLAGREIGRTVTSLQPIVDGTIVSPAPWLLTSQDQVEPIIRHHVERLPTVRMRWQTELTDLTVGPDGATTTLRSTADGSTDTLRADWLIAADGAGSTVRQHLDIAMEGQHDLATLVNCHFHADLGPWTDHRPAILYWTTAPARNVFQKIDLDDRWLCQIGYDPRTQRPEDFDHETAAAWIRRSVGDDTLGVDVLDVIPWTMSSTVAERYREGRVLLVGDAAHQLPPSGGFGMNTGVQDAHNLAWKLAYVLRGWAGEALLDTYGTERAPIARYNADRSLENTRNVGRIRKLAERRARSGERGSGDDSMEAEAVAAAGRYGDWLGMDLGLHYKHGCLVPDGTEPSSVADPVADYVPTARPGHRAPHIDVTIEGRTTSTLDLYDGHFTLVAGPNGERWVQAARQLTHPAIRTEQLGGRLGDPSGRFEALYGIGDQGAVLVRPDGHVAWRQSNAAPDDCLGLLTELVNRLLGG